MTRDANGRIHTQAGVRTGGQYATQARSEADVALAGGIELDSHGRVNRPKLDKSAREWADGIDRLTALRERQRALEGGTPAHAASLGRESVLARQVAIMSDPHLVNHGLFSERTSDQARAVLRALNDGELAQMPVPAPLSRGDRARAIELFADQAARETSTVVPDMARGAHDACLDAVADLGAASDGILSRDIADSLQTEEHHHGRSLTGREALQVVNRRRASHGLDPL